MPSTSGTTYLESSGSYAVSGDGVIQGSSSRSPVDFTPSQGVISKEGDVYSLGVTPLFTSRATRSPSLSQCHLCR
jgi:hypothetical protein